MSKVIFFIRVSSDKQNTELQYPSLQLMSQRDGVSNDDIIVIEESGESASKLTYEERKTIQDAIDAIETQDVTCIYAYEISRLARRTDTLHRFVKFCEERGVNIKTYVDGFVLLDENKKINIQASWLLSIMGVAAENESRMLKERVVRDIKMRVESGRAVGHVPFGYKRDRLGHIEIDEEKANIVRLIYTTYAKGDLGLKRLGYYLEDRGIKLSKHTLQNILSTPAYFGGKGLYSKYENIIYPRIVDEHTEQIVKSMKGKTLSEYKKKKTKQTHLGHRLLICPECGHTLVQNGQTNGGVYMCLHHQNNTCNFNKAILVKNVDNIIKKVVIERELMYLLTTGDEHRRKQERLLEDYKLQLNTKEKKLSTSDKKIERVQEIYIETGNKELYNKSIARINKETESLRKEVRSLVSTIRRLEDSIDKTLTQKERFFKGNDYSLGNVEDMNYLSDLTKKHILKVLLKVDENTLFFEVYLNENTKPYIFKHTKYKQSVLRWDEEEQNWIKLE